MLYFRLFSIIVIVATGVDAGTLPGRVARHRQLLHRAGPGKDPHETREPKHVLSRISVAQPQVRYNSNRCGPQDTTSDATPTSGPNGSIDWLDCGVQDDGGWNPPFLAIDDLVMQNLTDLTSQSGNIFEKCAPVLSLFYKYGNRYQLPPMILASIAMHESGCDPTNVGEGGEQGIMQISQDKCTGAPNGNCKDPDFNIMKGAQFFANTLRSNHGNVVKAMGQYNGWFVGMTVTDATARANSSCCRCQNNLDYLQQFFNGWLQGVNVDNANPRLGKYFNLDVCDSQ